MARYAIYLAIACCLFSQATSAFQQLDSIHFTPDDLKRKQQLSIVFASQNIKSPVSMFGHTFLVLHDDPFPEPDSIVVEFLGQTNMVPLAQLQALARYIPGSYHLAPFYEKFRQYDLESRDMWIYRITLSESAKNELLERIEGRLSDNNFQYTFISYNCSYYVLDLLLPKGPRSGLGLYTLPRDTIETLQEIGLINTPPLYVPSLQKRLIDFHYANDNNERQLVEAIANGFGYSEEALSRSVLITANDAINYKLLREPSQAKRTQYYGTKLRLLSNPSLIEDDLNSSAYQTHPLDEYGDTSVRFGFRLESNYRFLEIKPAQRDFFTNHSDNLSAAYLEVMKLKVGLSENVARLDQLTVFKIESLIPPNPYESAFNRLLDISYYSWRETYKANSDEFVLRYGHGISNRDGNLVYGAIPFLGMRRFHIHDSVGTEVDAGILTRLSSWINSNVQIEVRNIKTLLQTKMPFSWNTSIKGLVQLNERLNLGLETTMLDDNLYSEISMNYGF